MPSTFEGASRALSSFDDREIYVAWKHEDGRKPPISVRTRLKCDTADLSHLGTLAQAKRVAEVIGGGVGLVLMPLPDNPEFAIGMIDLDGCRDPETGELTPWALAIIQRLGSYAEVSPSQTGVKVFFLYRVADLPRIQKLIGKGKLAISWKRGEHEGVETYLGKRYGTITGQACDDYSVHIGEPTLFEIDFETIGWLIEDGGPACLLQGAGHGPPDRDQSRSAVAWRFCLGRFRAGLDGEAVRIALLEDDGEAGRWAAIAREVEVDRTITRARDHVAAEQSKSIALLDDDLRLVASAGASERSPQRVAADAASAFGDVANGAAHADRLRGARLYVSKTEQSLAWSGERWVAQTPEDVMDDAKETSAQLIAQATADLTADPSERNRALLNRAGRLHGSAAALTRMIEMSRSEPGMSVPSPDFFDRDPYTLTVRNGLLTLRTGVLRSARPEDHVSRLAGTHYDPAAACPLFNRFVATVLPDPIVRSFIQRAVGYTLSGSVDEEVFFVAHGTGANGKSVFANIIAALLGEYAGSFGAALVTRNKHENEASRMLTRLPGLRLALVNETGVADLWDSARMKELASRERMSARELYSKSFDFMPTAKLWIRTNHLPGSLDAGQGFWRRCVPIPFTVQVPPNDRIADLDHTIIARELPGVLNWALAGAMAWARDGLQVPAAIRAEIDTYKDDTDLLGQWLAERTIVDPRGVMLVGEAFRDYDAFCRDLGMHAGSALMFSRALASLGTKRDPSRKHGRRFLGIRLRMHLALDDSDVVAPGGCLPELADDCAELI